nr:MAG TPA: tax1-binding protein [Caudoviricetes sp.]DAS86600.1 MAG TPA: tax1-binding protein [Caudoviricetes sp.]
MIEIKPVRTVRAFRRCPVCREQLAPKGSNVRITVDAENEATAIEHITHKACAQTVIAFTRARGYTPAELAEVGVWVVDEALR